MFEGSGFPICCFSEDNIHRGFWRLFIFSFHFNSFFSSFFSILLFLKRKEKEKKAQDALCSLLLLMGVVLMTARVHAEEKIDDLLVVNFHIRFFTALLRSIFLFNQIILKLKVHSL